MKEGHSIVRDGNFKAVAEVRADSKNRVCLPKEVRSAETALYKVFVNELGQIVLDPQVTVPASEAWLFKNESALAAVRLGLDEASKGRLVRRASLAKHAKDEIE